ncbi:MAG: FtsX-like permease family protein [Pirellulaceae bacterium]
MSIFRLLKAEILHRKLNFMFSLVAVLTAATLFVAGPTMLRGYQRDSRQRLTVMQEETAQTLVAMEEKASLDLVNLDKRTKRIMRDLGFNLRIIHKNTDLTQLFAKFVSFDMPESYVEKLASSPEITKIVHLVATLKQMVEVDGQSRLLVGFAPESTQSHIEQKSPMGFQIKPGTVYLGHVAARKDEGTYQVGDKITVLGEVFEVARVLPPHGTSSEDIAIAMHLKDAQRVLNKPALISEIVALGCKCKTVDRIEEITSQLETVLPDTQVIELRTQAIAREDQRKLVTKYNVQQMDDYQSTRQEILQEEEAGKASVLNVLKVVTNYVIPLIVLVCVIWLGLLAWSNVRERRTEIGLLRAIGKTTSSIVMLFLGKAVLVGIVGGLIGCGLGTWLATQLAQSSVLEVSQQHFQPAVEILVATVLGAPLLTAMASYLPTLLAVQQDPAVVLMDH